MARAPTYTIGRSRNHSAINFRNLHCAVAAADHGSVLRFPHAGPTRPEIGEDEMGASLVGSERDHLAIDRVVLARADEQHQATVLRAQPPLRVATVQEPQAGFPTPRIDSAHSVS